MTKNVGLCRNESKLRDREQLPKNDFKLRPRLSRQKQLLNWHYNSKEESLKIENVGQKRSFSSSSKPESVNAKPSPNVPKQSLLRCTK